MGRSVTRMTIHDALHYDEATRERLMASYPRHVRRARAMGLPAIGEGAVFPIEDEFISVPGFDIPKHWMEIGGIDFGWDHPTTGARLVFDRESETTFLVDTYRKRQDTPINHVTKLKAWGPHLPFAWGLEGHQTKLSDDPKATKDIFKKHGLKMLDTHATFAQGGVGLEQGVQAMLEDMQTGKFKVFDHLTDFFEEKNSYHRHKSDDDKVAKIKPVHDDILDAVRYAHMMLRFAVPVSWRKRHGGRPTPKKQSGGRDTRDIFGD